MALQHEEGSSRADEALRRLPELAALFPRSDRLPVRSPRSHGLTIRRQTREGGHPLSRERPNIQVGAPDVFGLGWVRPAQCQIIVTSRWNHEVCGPAECWPRGAQS